MGRDQECTKSRNVLSGHSDGARCCPNVYTEGNKLMSFHKEEPRGKGFGYLPISDPLGEKEEKISKAKNDFYNDSTAISPASM